MVRLSWEVVRCTEGYAEWGSIKNERLDLASPPTIKSIWIPIDLDSDSQKLTGDGKQFREIMSIARGHDDAEHGSISAQSS